MRARRARTAPPRMVAVLGIAVALVAATACSSKTPPAPAVITATTAGVGVGGSCPSTEGEVVLATGPVAVGTSVADAVAAGTLVRASIPMKYRPSTSAVADTLEGTVVVPLPARSIVVTGMVAPASGPPVPIAPPASCWTGPDEPASVLVTSDTVPAGTPLVDAVRAGLVVTAEIPSRLRPVESIIATGYGVQPSVEPTAAAAVTDLPPNTVATEATFA